MSVPGRRHPFQVLIAIFATLTALSFLVLGPSPGSVAFEALGPVLSRVWAAFLLYSGVLLLVAAYVPDKSARLRQVAFWSEYLAHPVLAFSSLAYAFPLLSVYPRGAFSAGILTATALASATRWLYVERTRRRTMHQIENENSDA